MRSFFFLALLLLAGNLPAQVPDVHPDYGLEFASYDVTTDHRTGLNLNPDDAYTFREDFTIEFDLAFRALQNAYGYILRIIANDSTNIDLMSIPEHDAFGDISLVINKEPTPIQFDFLKANLKPFQWTTVKIHFIPSRNQISVQWNGEEKQCTYALKDLHSFRFFFGVNDFGKFSTTDAPPVVIRNIALTDGTTMTHKWLLKEHGTEKVYDSIRNAVALVKDPRWLIDHHIRWKHLKSFTLQRFPSVAFRSDSSMLYAMDENTLTTYDLATGKLVRTPNRVGHPVHTESNQLFFAKDVNALINYDVLSNRLNLYDLKAHGWKNHDTTHFEVDYWHNNKFFNPIDSSLYVFGGYGHYMFKNNFFRHSLSGKGWVNVDVKGFIPPRYLAASGVRESSREVLIFGGFGSASGKQELSPQAYYDLYSFNMKTHEVRKMQDYPAPDPTADVVFSNSLVVNEHGNSFYVLGFYKRKFKNEIRLMQYFLDRPEAVLMPDSIPFNFHDEDSFCDLFFSARTSELIAVTVHRDKQLFVVNIYSIGYPPLMMNDVLQKEKTALALGPLMSIGVGLLVVASLLVYAYRKKKQPEASPSVITSENIFHPTDKIPDLRHDEQKRTSSIMLFGGFQMYDEHGVEISAKFTSTLKELFLLILLHSVDEIGVTASVIQESLWPDKDDTSARNNRNVNLKKLRDILTEMKGVTIENTNSVLRVIMDDTVFCDYQVVSRLLNPEYSAGISGREKINLIIRNIRRGVMLQDMSLNSLDNHISNFSNLVIDTLLEYAHQLNQEKDSKLLLEIADCTFLYDPINQEALVIKCNVLNKHGKYSLAKKTYDLFVSVYKNLYAENYPRSFEEIITGTGSSLARKV